MSLQDEFRQALPREEELVAADQRITKAGGSSAGSPECPTKAQLMFFVAGRFNAARAGTIAEHLAECDSCTSILAEIHAQQKFSQTRISRRRVFAAVAVVVLVAAVVAIWLIRARSSSEMVTADLRDITRGVEASPDSGVVLHRNTRRLRVLLAPQAVEGHYEIALFNAMDRTSPLITRSASSSRENDSLMLEGSVFVSNLQSGPYLLGIRHDNTEWAYYAIRID